MRNLNFDGFKNIDVPEKWIENAINIPNTRKEKNPLLRISRVVSVAACFIVVCVLSVSSFLLIYDNNKEKIISTENTTSYAEFHSENTQMTYSEKSTERKKTSSTVDTKNDDVIFQENTENKYSNESIEMHTTETTEKSEMHSTKTSRETKPVVNNATTLPIESTTLSTEENSIPSETEEYSESTATVPLTSEKATGNRVDSDYATTTSVPICSGKISKKDVVGKGRIYCRIYDESGYLLGDENLYARSHLVHTKTETKNYVRVTYDPMEAKPDLKKGRYTYVFYNEKGKDVATGNFKV